MQKNADKLVAVNNSFFSLSDTPRATQVYSEYKFYCNVSLISDFGVNMLFALDLYLNTTDSLTDSKEKRSCYFHTYLQQSSLPLHILLPSNMYAGNPFRATTTTFTPRVFLNSMMYQQQQRLFVALLILNDNYTSRASLWAGISFSYSHIYRDMVTVGFYQVGAVNVTDSFSLFATAPFADTSVNIGGKDNIAVVSSQQGFGYSFVLFTRLFNTGDTYGDEILSKRTNQ